MPAKIKLTENKVKVEIVLDRDLLRKIKVRNVNEGRTISEIIQDALIKYIDTDTTKYELRRTAINRFCSKPFNLNTKEINEILNHDIYKS
jgi:metal-responsive CopG/Arc/MetJ family transcriptional regulator